MLVFVDTNVFLDFYRFQKESGGMGILNELLNVETNLITTDQVQMEFMKNRQEVIRLAKSELVNSSKINVHIPTFLAEKDVTEIIRNSTKRIKKHADHYKAKLDSMLTSPQKSDPVYRICQRLWKSDQDLNLIRGHWMRETIRDRARKRFELGYPPRKSKDTVFGDAINWEWIVECAVNHKSDVEIVSRDSDYGLTSYEGGIINDWLREEFGDRVPGGKTIRLSTKLAPILKQLNISVTSEAEKAEDELVSMRYKSLAEQLDEIRDIFSSSFAVRYLRDNNYGEVIKRLQEQQQATYRRLLGESDENSKNSGS